MSASRELPPELELDYQTTIDMIKLLTDIRFKLLAFVPTVSGFAVTLLDKSPDNATAALSVGALGFAVTLGIVLYDLRNSQIYNLSMHRGKWLEYLLDMPRLTTLDWQKPNEKPYHGGLITERPFRLHRLFKKRLLRAKHDRALALVYGASLGGWTYLIVNSLASLVFSAFIVLTKDIPLQTAISIGSFFLAVLIAAGFAIELNRLDNLGKKGSGEEEPVEKEPVEEDEKTQSEKANDYPKRSIAALQAMKHWYHSPRPEMAEPSTDDKL